MRLDAERNLAAGGHQQDIGLAIGRIGQDIAALGQPRGRGINCTVEGRDVLACKDEDCRLVMELHDDFPGLDHLVGIGGAEHDEAGDRPQRGQLLDRLMRRTVLAHADRVVSEDVDHRDLHDRGQADGHPAVVAEDQEPGAEGPDLDQRHAVQDGPHRVLADAEMEVAASIFAGLEVAGAVEGQAGLGRRCQVGRTAHKPGDIPRHRVEDQAGRIARGHSLAVGGERRQACIPAVGELAMLHPVELVGQFGVLGPVALDPGEPGVAQFLATPADAVAEVIVDSVGHEEFGILGPAVVALGEPDFFFAQRLAVGGAGVLLVGRTPADVAIDDDQGRPLALLEEDAEGAVEQIEVVGVSHPGRRSSHSPGNGWRRPRRRRAQCFPRS